LSFKITILGSSGALPAYGRFPSSQLVEIQNRHFLVDCGEGAQMQLMKFQANLHRINHIFVSHLHGDHYLGLIGLLSSMHLLGRKDELHIYGPPPLRELIDQHLLHSQTVLRYPLHFHPTQDQQRAVLLETEHLQVTSFPLDHRIPCTGFRFDEKPRLPSIDRAKAEAAGVPVAYFGRIKQGQDYTAPDHTVHRWQDLTSPPAPPRSYAYCSDTIRTDLYLPYIQQVGLLYHEATFLHEMLDRAEETYHTTALQAGQIAAEAGARKLLIGHYSARYKDLKPLLEESRTAFSETELALEGNWYIV